jgi:hypothetical protein
MELARRLRDLARRHRVDAVSGVSPSHIWRAVMRWEAGDSQPSARYQLLLAYAYAESDDLATVGAGAGLDRLLDAFQLMGVSTDRRTFLRSMAAAASSAGLPALIPELPDRAAWALAHPDKVDVTTVRWIGRAVGDLMQQSEGGLPYQRLATGVAPYHAVVRRLLDGAQPDRIRSMLIDLGVETFHFAGRIAFNLRDRGAASWNLREADRLAADLGTGSLRRWWLASRARVARFREHDPDAALTLAGLACKQAHRESDYVGFWTHCVQAEMLSHHGKHAAVRRSIDIARWFADRIQETSPVDDDGDPLASLFPEARYGGATAVSARIDAYEGTCCLRSGDLDGAEAAFGRVLAGLSPGGIDGQRAFVLADLATVDIRRGEVEGACVKLGAALDLAERTGARIPLQRIQRARRELRPWADSAHVRDLDEKLFGPLEL